MPELELTYITEVEELTYYTTGARATEEERKQTP
jgi:hypothetical protein